MNSHKPDKSENKNLKPEFMFFLFQVHCAGFFGDYDSDEEKKSTHTIKVNEWKPGIFERMHLFCS